MKGGRCSQPGLSRLRGDASQLGSGENPEPLAAAGVVRAAHGVEESQALALGSGSVTSRVSGDLPVEQGWRVKGDEDLESAWIPLGKACSGQHPSLSTSCMQGGRPTPELAHGGVPRATRGLAEIHGADSPSLSRRSWPLVESGTRGPWYPGPSRQQKEQAANSVWGRKGAERFTDPEGLGVEGRVPGAARAFIHSFIHHSLTHSHIFCARNLTERP